MINPDDPVSVGGPASEIPIAARPGARTWALALAAGLAAGVVAWGIGEMVLVPEVGIRANKEHKIGVSPSTAGIQNGILCFGALGAATGLGLGLVGGMIGGSVLRSILAGAAGLVLAGGLAAGVSWLILPVYFDHAREGDMTYSLMAHGGAWIAVGAGAGLAFGIGLGRWRGLARGLVGGAGAAMIATILYEFGGGLLFPSAYTDRPISPIWQGRLAARLLVTVLIAVGLVLASEPTSGTKNGAGGPASE